MYSRLDEINELDAVVMAIDPHESYAAEALMNQAGLETEDTFVPVLTDPSITVSAMYGVAFQMRIHVEISNRPATFIIDREGVLRYQRRATSFADRPGPQEIIDVLKKLQ